MYAFHSWCTVKSLHLEMADLGFLVPQDYNSQTPFTYFTFAFPHFWCIYPSLKWHERSPKLCLPEVKLFLSFAIFYIPVCDKGILR